MRAAGLIAAVFSVLLLVSCDASRDKSTVKVVLPPDAVQQQSCQALLDPGAKGEEEVVLNGVAEHGHPDVLRVHCEAGDRMVIFGLMNGSDDLGMKKLRKAWQSRSRSDCKDYRECPKYDVSGTFVGSLRPDPSDRSRLLYFVRTADKLKRHRIARATR